MLFEYFVTRQKMTEEDFDELMIELKGEEMPSLARIWWDRGKDEGKLEGIQEGILKGKLEEIYNNLKMGFETKFIHLSKDLFPTIQKINEIQKLKEIQKALFIINDEDEFRQFVYRKIDEEKK